MFPFCAAPDDSCQIQLVHKLLTGGAAPNRFQPDPTIPPPVSPYSVLSIPVKYLLSVSVCRNRLSHHLCLCVFLQNHDAAAGNLDIQITLTAAASDLHITCGAAEQLISAYGTVNIQSLCFSFSAHSYALLFPQEACLLILQTSYLLLWNRWHIATRYAAIPYPDKGKSGGKGECR